MSKNERFLAPKRNKYITAASAPTASRTSRALHLHKARDSKGSRRSLSDNSCASESATCARHFAISAHFPYKLMRLMAIDTSHLCAALNLLSIIGDQHAAKLIVRNSFAPSRTKNAFSAFTTIMSFCAARESLKNWIAHVHCYRTRHKSQ